MQETDAQKEAREQKEARQLRLRQRVEKLEGDTMMGLELGARRSGLDGLATALQRARALLAEALTKKPAE